MRKAFLILFSTFIFFIFSISSVSAVSKSKTLAPKCEIGYNYIILSSAPDGSVCLEDSYYQQLSPTIRNYKSQIDSGTDINTLLSEIRSNMNSADQYSPDGQAGMMYAIVLDRVKRYGEVRCSIENQKASITIPSTGIYLDNTLTPVCSYPKPRTVNANIFLNLSLSWIDSSGETVLYRGSG